MPNSKYKLDPSGSYVKSDPFLESITKPKTPIAKATEPTVKVIGSEESLGIGQYAPPPTTPATPDHQAPTSPVAAAVAPLTTPTAPTAPTAPSLVSQAPGNAGQPANATIWNPNTGEKKPWTIGAPMPGADWKLWTGGTATGQEAQDAITAGQTGEEAPPSTDVAGDALTEEPPGEDEEPPATEDPWEVPEVSEILSDMGIETTTIHNYDEDKQDLIDWRDNQLDEIDGIYEERFAEQTKADENSLSALQAQLLKAGVSLDGTSFQSATAGEIARAAERMRKLERDKAADQAKVNDSYLKGKMDLGKQERDEVWNAKVFDYDNIFKGKGIQRDMWTMFNERDQFERQQEQDEQQHLANLNLEFYKMDEKQRSEGLGRVQSNLEKGLYDMYNEDDVNLLYGLEDKYGLETGELTTPALAGYWKRMNNYFLTQAQTAKTEAETEYKETQTEQMKAKTLAAGLEAEEGGYPKGFWSAVKTATTSLQKGEKWGTVFDRMKLQFPSVGNEIVDKVLGGSWDAAKDEGEGWAETGAFEDWKSKQYKTDKPTKAESQAYIWKQIADNPDLSDATIAEWIMKEGFDPEDFNIYY